MDASEAEFKAYAKIIQGLTTLHNLDKSRKQAVDVEKTKEGKRILESSADFKDKTKRWSGHEEIAAQLAWQLYVKAQAYLNEGDAKNAHRFYTLLMKALKLSQHALERSSLEELEHRLKKLEAQSPD